MKAFNKLINKENKGEKKHQLKAFNTVMLDPVFINKMYIELTSEEFKKVKIHSNIRDYIRDSGDPNTIFVSYRYLMHINYKPF